MSHCDQWSKNINHYNALIPRNASTGNLSHKNKIRVYNIASQSYRIDNI